MSIQNKARPGAATRLARRTAKALPRTAATIGRCLIRALLCVVAVPSISDNPVRAQAAFGPRFARSVACSSYSCAAHQSSNRLRSPVPKSSLFKESKLPGGLVWLEGGQERAEYGKALIDTLAADLGLRHGKGFSRSNLIRLRQFYPANPDMATKGATPSHPLTWSRIVELLKIDGPLEPAIPVKPGSPACSMRNSCSIACGCAPRRTGA